MTRKSLLAIISTPLLGFWMLFAQFCWNLIEYVHLKRALISNRSVVCCCTPLCALCLLHSRSWLDCLSPADTKPPNPFHWLMALLCNTHWNVSPSLCVWVMVAISIGSHEVEKKFRAIEGLEKVQEEQCSQLIQECVYVRNDVCSQGRGWMWIGWWTQRGLSLLRCCLPHEGRICV